MLRALEADLDALGRPHTRAHGLLAVPGGAPAVSAHIDRHGFVTQTGGRLAYAASEAGAHRALTPMAAARICRRFEDEDVIAYDPDTGVVIATATVRHGDHCGIGPAIDLVAPRLGTAPAGTPVAFVAPRQGDEPWVRGQLDNALGAALAMELVAGGFEGSVLFTLGEEAGVSWEALAAWFDRPTDELIVLDTSPFDGSDPARRGVAVLRRADAGGRFSEAVTDRIERAADEANVPVVWKDSFLAAAGGRLGRTELGRLVAATDGSVSGSTLQIPTTDYHTNYETTSCNAIEAVGRILQRVASRW